MKNNNIQFDWNHAKAFLITAEEGSLSAAARALGVSQPTLGRQVTALENTMGVALFERGVNGLELTPNGIALLDYVKDMSSSASKFVMAANGKSLKLEGDVCITATETMATTILPPILVKLHNIEPGINIELISSNFSSDLKKREADIAIRAYRPTQNDLIAKKVGDEKYKLYASKKFLEQFGRPTTAEEMNRLNYIGFDKQHILIQILNERGLSLTDKNFPYKVDGSLAIWALSKAGAGISIMIDTIGDADQLMESIFDELKFPSSELWLVSHRELRTNRRIKYVFDFLSNELQNY